jgi:hypothetical protein
MRKLKNKIASKWLAGIGGVLTIKKFRDGKLIWQSEPMHNLVVSSDGYGRNLIMRGLKGDSTYGIKIDSAAVGDGTGAPADGDTALGNALVSSISISNLTLIAHDVLVVDVFASDATLPDDDYKEFGLFIGGRLFSRVAISPTYSKATGEDTIFTYTLTLSAV